MTFLERIPVSRRLLLISLSFTVPVAVMAWLIVSGMNADIAFARLERDGIQYLQPLGHLLDALGAQQFAAASGTPTDRGAVESALAAVDDVHARLGTTLQFTPDGLARRRREHFTPDTVRSEWKALESDRSLSSSARADRYQHLVDDVREMMAHAGDTSNLMLDPDMDSFYTVDVAVVAQPAALARLTRVSQLASAFVARTRTPRDAASELAVLAATLKENDGDRIKANLQTAISEDARFNGTSTLLQGTYAPAAEAYIRANEAVIAAVSALMTHPDGDPTLLDRSARQARTAAAAVAPASLAAVDDLVSARLSRLSLERTEALGFSAAVLAAALTLVFFISRSISVPLARTTADLSEGARQVMATSEQVSSAAQALSQGATEQAASLEETSASMEEMASMTRRNSDNTREAAQLVSEVHARVHSSEAALGDMVHSMSAIQESSQKVARIIKTIDEIAFQTNILALNAAVEAARAGEAGMGFAVVADEVRNLAQRSAQAARDTADLIEESIGRAQAGSGKVEQVVTAIHAITDSVNRVKGLIDEVTEASTQQTTGIDQVAAALSQMEKVTQGTAATAEESAASAEELSALANTTMEAVTRLRQLVGAETERQDARASAPPSAVQAARKVGTVVPMRARIATPAPSAADADPFPLENTGTFGSF
ncbi:MAG: hypothetical protein JSU08_18795 [Acidobacteria bacterium]|nr:hypothetical protein [Acidobacteriota bacterium]